ncbi:MAG TPA: DUF423 domain-containing protein [Rhizomicrobium sp.]|nr:DUF423 domain-containing protein [Rhizomicrobium sp.]
MRSWFAIAALNGFLAVAAGAFAAHSLATMLGAQAAGLFEVGARYQMYHALAIGLAALVMRAEAQAEIAAWFFLAGIIFFSGSLYALAVSGLGAFAYITPFGGLSFLIGWAALAWAALRPRT